MPKPDRLLGTYLHLSRASQLRQQPMVRDKLLVLAGVQAESMGLSQISELCRHRILGHNPRHLIGRWPTLAGALAEEPFQSYLKQLRRRYSAEKAEHMLDSLGIELGRERDAYFSDLEYAAALLDTRPEEIPAILARDPVLDLGGQPAEHGRTYLASSLEERRLARKTRMWIVGLLALAILATVVGMIVAERWSG